MRSGIFCTKFYDGEEQASIRKNNGRKSESLGKICLRKWL